MEFKLNLPPSQRRVEERLVSALKSGMFPRSLLIVGAPGIGKRPLAVELARVLSCLSSEQRPCGTCAACAYFHAAEGKTPWFWLLPIEGGGKTISGDEPSAVANRAEQTLKAIENSLQDLWSTTTFSSRSTTRIDSVRDVTRGLGLKDHRVRVVLVPEADRMERGAANALLKTLEEVPDNTYFILTTAHRSDLLPTILSRCTQIHLPEAPLSEMGNFLEARGLSTDQIGSVWALASGSPGQALIWAGERVTAFREMALQLLEWTAAADTLDLMLWWAEQRRKSKLKEEKGFTKEDATLLLQISALLLGDLAQMRSGLVIRNIDSASRLAALPFSREGFDTLQLMMNDLQEAEQRLSGYVSPERVVVALVLRWRSRCRLNLEWSAEEKE